MKKYEECACCGYIYTSENEEPDYVSDDNNGENAPTDWTCPICGLVHSNKKVD